jgi:hypothetical protein
MLKPGKMLCVLMILLGIVGVGCSSTTHGEKAVQSFTKTRETLADAERQVDVTLVTLHRLRSPSAAGLQEQFRAYKKSVEDLEKTGTDMKWQGNSMKEQNDAQIQAWQAEMKSIKDPTIKSSLESRQQAVKTNYKLLRLYGDDARKAYGPYLAGNQQMLKALSIDLSAAAVTSLSPSIDKVLLEGKALKEKIGLMQIALNNMANGVSPIGE